MPVIPWSVEVGSTVEARDGELGKVVETFTGPARSMFVDAEPYMRVTDSSQPDLFIPFSEIVDIGDIKRVVYLKRFLREINALGWTRDPRNPASRAVPFQPRPLRPRPALFRLPDGVVAAAPRPRGELGTWHPESVAPRPEPGRPVRIGDRFKPGDRIPQPGQYLCTICWARKHSRQFLEENSDGRFPPAHHPGGLWELEDLRP
jgi:hypothetical protein